MFTATAQKNLKRRLGENGLTMPAAKRIIMSSLPDRMVPATESIMEDKPDTTVYKVIKNCNRVSCSQLDKLQTPSHYPSYSELKGFFHPPTQEEVDAYQHDILTAVRNQDIESLRKFQAQGRPMKCSNEFGESILHLACRKGLTKVVKYLIEEAKVPMEVCDDYGRNCMHDAAWVHKPNFELIDLVLSKCPDLLSIKDRPGHTPLAFARRDQWKCRHDYFKTKSPEFLVPRKILELQEKNEAMVSDAAKVKQSTAAADTHKAEGAAPGIARMGMKDGTIQPKVAARGIQIPLVHDDIKSVTAVSAPATAALMALTGKNCATRTPTPALLPLFSAPTSALSANENENNIVSGSSSSSSSLTNRQTAGMAALLQAVGTASTASLHAKAAALSNPQLAEPSNSDKWNTPSAMVG